MEKQIAQKEISEKPISEKPSKQTSKEKPSMTIAEATTSVRNQVQKFWNSINYYLPSLDYLNEGNNYTGYSEPLSSSPGLDTDAVDRALETFIREQEELCRNICKARFYGLFEAKSGKTTSHAKKKPMSKRRRSV
ncbi:hypothetical protein AC579_8592 [Pseudocercospora musae]|uniref:Uncharacterized protein n=1 Tax=Pseudocercospora musae TaxID=113226 RepID=A0A139IB76_9PEZI|nr:hypothetical protein AC579_8592 [Pseudocercospora musae]